MHKEKLQREHLLQNGPIACGRKKKEQGKIKNYTETQYRNPFLAVNYLFYKTIKVHVVKKYKIENNHTDERNNKCGYESCYK